MGSTYGGTDYFGSGPHRFSFDRRGLLRVPWSALTGDASVPATAVIGDRELKIFVTGRLVASSESALTVLREAIAGLGVAPGTGATLVDHFGNSYADMLMTQYQEDGPALRGRVWSVGYVCEFIRLGPPPF